MMNAALSFSQLDCKASLKALAPLLARQKGDKDSPSPLQRFFGRMGSRGEDMVLALIDEMPEEALEEILLGAVSAYEAPLTRQINRTLRAHEVADSFSVERLSVWRDADTREIRLLLEGVNVNYALLVDNETVMQKADELIDGFLDRHAAPAAGQALSLLARTALRKGAKAAHIVYFLARHPMDRRCVQLLEMDAVKRPLLTHVEGALRQAGVQVSLRDAAFTLSDARAVEPAAEEKRGFLDAQWISPESRRAAAAAFASYLNRHLGEA